jgi:hypothetical protein
MNDDGGLAVIMIEFLTLVPHQLSMIAAAKILLAGRNVSITIPTLKPCSAFVRPSKLLSVNGMTSALPPCVLPRRRCGATDVTQFPIPEILR